MTAVCAAAAARTSRPACSAASRKVTDPASAVAPFEYTALAWAVLLDWVFWRSVPDAYTLAGGAIIIASGIYLIRREAPREMVVVPP